jgi:hypothetical protein
MRVTRFAALLLLAFSSTALAVNEPTADWNPNPDSDSPEGVDNPGAVASPDGTAEITINGAPFIVTGTPTGGVVNLQAVALVTCSVNQLSGAAGALTLVPPNGFSMSRITDLPPPQISTWSPPGTITLTCTNGAAPVTGLLTCDQVPKFPPGRTIKTWWDVSCPPVGAPEWNSTPANGSPINLSTTVGSPTTAPVNVQNTGASDLTVVPTGLSGALSVTGAGATATIPAGGNQTFTVTCNPASASTSNQTLSFDTNDATGGEDPVTFPVQCVGNAAAAPEFNSAPADGATISLTTAVGGSTTSGLNISNSGTAALTGTISGLGGVLGIAPGTLNIAGGANQNYTITCSPVSATTVIQTLTVTSNDADESPATYTVQCTGSSAPAPEFSSNPLAGATLSIATNVGAPGTDTVMVTNNGNADLQVSASIGGGPVFSVAPSTAQTITAGNSRMFTVTCTPASAGLQIQTLTLATNDADENPVTYSVNCTGQAPEFESTPAAPGPITLTGTAGGTDPTAPITISNTGSANLVIASATGLNGDLGLVAPPAFPATITPGNSLVLTVRCDAGNQDTDNDVLSLDTNDADEDPVTFNVDCTIGPAGAADFFSNPAPGAIVINTSPTTAGSTPIFVQNVGGAALAITSATFTPTAPTTTEITVTPAAPASLAAGASQVFTVNCLSAVAGTFSGTYSIVHADAGESPADFPITCNVSNSAPDYASTPAPSSTIALSAVVGSNVTGTVTARNVGGGTLNVSAAIPGGPVFSVAPAGPTPIAGGASQALTLTCAPTATTTQTQTLTVTTDEPVAPTSYTYTVTCTGLAPAGGEFDPTVPNGGTITLNTTRGTSVGSVLTVANSGTSNLSITGAALTTGTVITALPVVPPTIVINPGLTRNFNLTCLSATPGVFNDTYTFTTSDADEGTVTYQVTCVVADIPPDINTLQSPATPITINALFGAPSTTVITVQNTAAATGGTLNVATAGLFSPLAITAPGGGGAAIAPGAQQDFTIQCFPTVVFVGFPPVPVFQIGTFTQQLTFTSDDPDENPVNFTVTCNSGFAPQPEYSSVPDPGQTITINTFPNVSATAQVRVSNSGSLPDSVTPTLVGAPEITIAPAAATPVGTGASADFVLTCLPTATGSTTSTLTIGSLDPDELANSYNVVCNAGVAPEPELQSLPGSGTPISLTGLPANVVTAGIGITNIGNFTLRVLSCSTTGPGFSLAAAPAFPLDIAPADSAVVTVVCNVPPIGVPVSGNLTCQTSDADEPVIRFPLDCRGLTQPPTNVPGPGGPWLALLALALAAIAGRTLQMRRLRVRTRT